MDKGDFELNVWLAAEPKYAETLRELAAHAARYAGCEPEQVEQYAAAVERVVLACMAHGHGGGVPLVFRRGGGPLECLVACEGGVEAGTEGRVSVSWTHEHGTAMCRVAVEL
jgi:nitroimidazol reductase NimA-like FMN-containing flavoprotein (pyridoxamine 5'-phosphate oxidase superfamily)